MASGPGWLYKIDKDDEYLNSS